MKYKIVIIMIMIALLPMSTVFSASESSEGADTSGTAEAGAVSADTSASAEAEAETETAAEADAALSEASSEAAPADSQEQKIVLHGKTLPENDGPVYVIPIKGEINQNLTVFIRRSIEKAKAENACCIIFDIDTFGGRVDSALQITTLIGSLSEITTIAYVGLQPEGTAVSWSAGALISFSSDFIFMAPGTSMGAAAPILQSPDGTSQPANEKTVSAVRTQMASLAEKNGYPPGIALAMVDLDVELLEVYVDGELQVLTRNEFETLQRTASENLEIIEGSTISASGKLLSLTAEQLKRYKVSSGTFMTYRDMLAETGLENRKLMELSPSGADRAVSLLTGSTLSSILILIGIIALFMEITSPGFGIPGTIAVLAFAALFSGNALLGNVGSVELLLFVTGVALLIIEIFLIPGFGLAGISGIAMMVIGLIFSMQDFLIPDVSWQWDIFGRNALLVLGNVIAGFIFFSILAFLVPKYTPFKRLTLSLNQDTSLGYTSQNAEEEIRYVGKTGRAVTALHPSGKAEIDGEVQQVVTSGEYIEKDTPITVSTVSGNRIVVKKM
ncbi:MAG: nodulation protein NfeD [Spirochaetales bacterium]|nr:nodulation protein NfeD [Spirochaetales bacterium]